MNEQLSDKTVILIIAGTILLIFILVFSFKSTLPTQEQLIQWREIS